MAGMVFNLVVGVGLALDLNAFNVGQFPSGFLVFLVGMAQGLL